MTLLTALAFKIVCLGMASFMAVLYLASLAALLELLGYALWSSLALYPGNLVRYYLLFEAAFIVFNEFRYRIWNTHSAHHLPSMTEDRFNALYNEFVSTNLNPQQFIEGWFMGSKAADLTRCDMESWVCAMFFHVTSTSELDHEQLVMLEKVVSVMEEKFAYQLPKRLVSQAPLDKITLTVRDPLFLVRPALFYIAIRFAFWGGLLLLSRLGFTSLSVPHPGLDCYHRKALKCLAPPHQKPAIVLFHGLGIGLSTYARFIQKLMTDFPEQDVVLFEMASISMRLNTDHVLPSEFADHVADTLSRLGIEEAVFV
ncbi:hypothetical protein HDU91_000277, partial [Kappamyces sp. JEL0680]